MQWFRTANEAIREAKGGVVADFSFWQNIHKYASL